MDLRPYYQKIRKIEAEITDPFVIIISRPTEDGGKQGLKTEVSRHLAAKLIAEEKADLASTEEATEFRALVERQWRAVLEEFDGSDEDAKPVRNPARPKKQ